MREFSFSQHNTTVSTDIQYKGTSYKKGHFLVSKNDLIKNDASVYFVVDIHRAEYHPEYHLYSVTKQSSRLQCLNINDLVDFYPLPSYMVDGNQVILLKHSVLSR